MADNQEKLLKACEKVILSSLIDYPLSPLLYVQLVKHEKYVIARVGHTFGSEVADAVFIPSELLQDIPDGDITEMCHVRIGNAVSDLQKFMSTEAFKGLRKCQS